jgi:hypothetical protein
VKLALLLLLGSSDVSTTPEAEREPTVVVDPFVDALGLQRGGIISGRTMPPRDQGFAFAVNTDLFRIGFAM